MCVRRHTHTNQNKNKQANVEGGRGGRYHFPDISGVLGDAQINPVEFPDESATGFHQEGISLC